MYSVIFRNLQTMPTGHKEAEILQEATESMEEKFKKDIDSMLEMMTGKEMSMNEAAEYFKQETNETIKKKGQKQ